MIPSPTTAGPALSDRDRGRGLLFVALASASVGVALTLQISLNANFLVGDIGISGMQAGFLEAVRESCARGTAIVSEPASAPSA